MAEPAIRRAVAYDAEQLAPLHLRVWAEAYAGLIAPDVLADRAAKPLARRIESWRRRVESNVAEHGGRILGWAESGPGRDRDVEGPELMSLYIVAAVYGQGVGHRLLRAAIGDDAAYLWVLEGNSRAIAFYERHGFSFDGAMKDDPPYGTEHRMVRGTSGA